MMSQSSITSPAIESPGCVAVAVTILGDKWTPHIIRALAGQHMRFCRLQDAVGGVNPRTLSARLGKLEEMGILSKETYSQIPPHTEYSLTPKGQDLLPILERMAAWGAKYGPEAEA